MLLLEVHKGHLTHSYVHMAIQNISVPYIIVPFRERYPTPFYTYSNISSAAKTCLLSLKEVFVSGSHVATHSFPGTTTIYKTDFKCVAWQKIYRNTRNKYP